MSKHLTAVTRTARQRKAADERYRTAVEVAATNGHSLSEIGRAAGITPQGVRYLLHPDPRKEKAT